MERLKKMKESLMNCVESQIHNNLKEVDAKELGEAVDMIKDLEEAMYYATITEAMHAKEKPRHYYSYPEYFMPMDYKGEADWEMEAMGHKEYQYPPEMRDYREGKSPKMRRSYMESKELHKDTKVHMTELEKYMKELSADIIEMIEGATPEEKQLLKTKLTTLSGKINV